MQIARIKYRFMIISVNMFIKKDLRCKSFFTYFTNALNALCAE